MERKEAKHLTADGGGIDMGDEVTLDMLDDEDGTVQLKSKAPKRKKRAKRGWR